MIHTLPRRVVLRARFLNCGRALGCFDVLGAVSEIKKQLSEIEIETVNNIKGTVR